MAYVIPVEMVAGGLTVTVDPTLFPEDDIIVYLYTTSSFTLTGDINVIFSNNCGKGYKLIVYQSSTSITRGGKLINIVCPTGGFSYNENWQFGLTSVFHQLNADSANFSSYIWWDLVSGTGVDASTALLDASVSLNKLTALTDGSIIVGNGSNRPAEVAVTGDIAITNAGVTSISAGAIVNADVNASAAIARSKMASGTASHVVINDGSGVLSSEAQLAASRGGTALDTSASTGFATVSAGTWSVGSISDVITLDVSFESGEVGDFKVKLPYACTVAEIYAYAYKVIAGTDAGTIVPKDNGGTTMTGGTITFAASDPRGTAYTSTPSANNTFTAGQLLTLTTAKTTAGGKVLVSVKVTRNL